MCLSRIVDKLLARACAKRRASFIALSSTITPSAAAQGADFPRRLVLLRAQYAYDFLAIHKEVHESDGLTTAAPSMHSSESPIPHEKHEKAPATSTEPTPSV